MLVKDKSCFKGPHFEFYCSKHLSDRDQQPLSVDLILVRWTKSHEKVSQEVEGVGRGAGALSLSSIYNFQWKNVWVVTIMPARFQTN